MPDLHAVPAYEPEHYADRIYGPLMLAVASLTKGMAELHTALDRCPSGNTHELLEIIDERLAHDVMPMLNDAVEIVSGGTP